MTEQVYNLSLVFAVTTGDAARVRALLAAGESPNATDNREVPLLCRAVRAGQAEMMRLLLEAGAGPDASGPDGETPLMAAARRGAGEMVSLLVAAGADLDLQDNRGDETALAMAARGAYKDIIKILLDAGADPTMGEADVTSPLEVARAAHNDAEIMATLEKAVNDWRRRAERETAHNRAARRQAGLKKLKDRRP